MVAKITIIGTGYVGLVSGACFAELGHDVICVDKADWKIKALEEGRIPIYEPGLEEIVRRNSAAGRLRFSTETAASVKDRDAIFIAVGTPTQAASNFADLSYVFSATQEVAAAINGFTVIVLKSTVPVGTNARVHQICKEHVGSGVEFCIASNPEFLREGSAIVDFMEPDRIVVGAEDKRGLEVLRRIYMPLTVGRNAALLMTSSQSAEIIKYAANAFLAVKVSFINEIANLCEAASANINDVATGIGLDSRIGRRFLNTGPGWGGSCFPKDTRALLATASQYEVDCKVVQAALDANEERKTFMIDKIIKACGGAVKGKRISILGVTFKGQTDDMRESASLVILPELLKQGAEVAAFDPSIATATAELLPGVSMTASAVDAAKGSDLLVVLTDWMVFKTYDLAAIAKTMRHPHMLDLRNLYDANDVKMAGFSSYTALGIVQPA